MRPSNMVKPGGLAAELGLSPPRFDIDDRGDVCLITFEIPPPCSKKNNTEMRRRGRYGKRWITPNDQVRSEARRMRQAVSEGMARLGLQEPLFGEDDDVELELRHLIDRDVVQVTFRRIGPPLEVKGRTGRKRDVINLFDAVGDAMNGLVYGDDKQIALCSGRRCLGGAT